MRIKWLGWAGVEIEVPIPPAGAPTALGELLRVTALHDVVVPCAIEPHAGIG
jgi:hypothetical protein